MNFIWGYTPLILILNTMESLKEKLWNERGYDYSYMNTLTDKELKSLYDTEFYYE